MNLIVLIRDCLVIAVLVLAIFVILYDWFKKNREVKENGRKKRIRKIPK